MQRKQKANPIQRLCRQAREAALRLTRVSSEEKNAALRAMAKGLREHSPQILRANAKDLRAYAKKKPSQAFIDRLTLTDERLAQMAHGLEAIAALADPVGKEIRRWQTPAGLLIRKVQIPIGVIAFIYEARPNVTSDAAGLCLKSGNAVILRGGSEAFFSNQAITRVLQKILVSAQLPPAAIQTLATTDRRVIDQLLRRDEDIDLVIPRGGEALIRRVARLSRIPVLKHYKGVCHLYIDEDADPDMAERICINAKVQRPGVCNAIETLLVHRAHEKSLLPRLLQALQNKGVEIRAPKPLLKKYPGLTALRPKDYGTEFLDLIIALRVVDSVDEAIAHIQRYGSNHTESIVTRDAKHAQQFLQRLQSSVVLVNASTRLADGGEMGMGAEIGISTTKLHAYGPMGLDDLTVGRYLIEGQGQIRK